MKTTKRISSLFTALVAILVLGGCSPKQLEVTVTNPGIADRENETVEIAWQDVTAAIQGIQSDNVVVTDIHGRQIPSQAVYEGMMEPKLLIFQVDVAASASESYIVKKGKREKYPVQAYGRFVPERKDDYAWEDNLGAYRLYGPALTDPLTPGIDVWVKSTQDMIIDKWYKIDDYHTNHGEGMDAYKVGKTLGGGACAPMVDGKLWLSGNYATQENLDNGPLRTTVRLTYAPFKAGEHTVAMVKIISLDANSYFSKMTNIYTGDFEMLPIAAGIILHNVKDNISGCNYVAVTEEVSDSKQPEIDGDISLGVIMPSACMTEEVEGHLVVVGNAVSEEPLVYWSGAGWSQAGIESAEMWNEIVLNTAAKLTSPLLVTLK